MPGPTQKSVSGSLLSEGGHALERDGIPTLETDGDLVSVVLGLGPGRSVVDLVQEIEIGIGRDLETKCPPEPREVHTDGAGLGISIGGRFVPGKENEVHQFTEGDRTFYTFKKLFTNNDFIFSRLEPHLFFSFTFCFLQRLHGVQFFSCEGGME